MANTEDSHTCTILPGGNEAPESHTQQLHDVEHDTACQQTDEDAEDQSTQEAKNDDGSPQADMISKDLTDKFEAIDSKLSEVIATLTRIHSENKSEVGYLEEAVADWRARMGDIEQVATGPKRW